MTTFREHRLARALVAAHVPDDVADTVLDAIDGWHDVVATARDAIEHASRSEDDLRRYYTVRELTMLFRKSDTAVRAMLDEGVLPQTRIGGSIRVPIAAAEQYLAEHTKLNEPTPRDHRPRRSAEDEQALAQYPFLAED
jgi:excisionase family DNA binding protein